MLIDWIGLGLVWSLIFGTARVVYRLDSDTLSLNWNLSPPHRKYFILQTSKEVNPWVSSYHISSVIIIHMSSAETSYFPREKNERRKRANTDKSLEVVEK